MCVLYMQREAVVMLLCMTVVCLSALALSGEFACCQHMLAFLLMVSALACFYIKLLMPGCEVLVVVPMRGSDLFLGNDC